jgi:3D (Asp-Asp-Asp) domain-containing protein
MSTFLKLTLTVGACCIFGGCAEQQHQQPRLSGKWPNPRRLQNVRTTAYSRGENGGRHNAVGHQLCGRNCLSAASDWSRFPLGTRFRVVGTHDEYIIDDYGVALIGTNTIDLYKNSRLEMRRWGVRRVDIDIVEWGSAENSLKVLAPRSKHRYVKRMIVDLQKTASARTQPRALD